MAAGSNKGNEQRHKAVGEHNYEGVIYCEVFPACSLTKVKTFELHPSDVIIAAYPKSGSSWMQEVVYLVQNDGDLQKAHATYLHERVPCMEFASDDNSCVDDLTLVSPPRLIKTHLYRYLYDKPLREGNGKFIVMLRNVKDTLVSYYHFYRSYVALGYFKGTFQEFFKDLVKTDCLNHGSWFDFTLGWWTQKDNPNVLFVKYEDMIKHLRAEIVRVATFLGKTLDDDIIDRIRDNVTFDAMKLNPSTNAECLVGYIDHSISAYMRKGKVADWKSHFTVEESEYIDHICKERFAGTGLAFQYE